MSEQSAFPYTEHCREGMTLRDYFAAKAMREVNWEDRKFCANECYEIADAMLEARAKATKKPNPYLKMQDELAIRGLALKEGG